MATWPTELVIVRDGYKEQPANNTMRSQMEIGPDKIRRRSTSAVRPISFNLFLTDDLLDTLDEFYTDTTYSGSVPFDFVDLRSGDTVSARFVEAPTYSRRSTMWDATISLEILP